MLIDQLFRLKNVYILLRLRHRWCDAAKLIFYTSNRQGIDCKCRSALKERLGTTFWLIDELGSGVGELAHGGRQGDAGGA